MPLMTVFFAGIEQLEKIVQTPLKATDFALFTT
jgi:hypothetical protein